MGLPDDRSFPSLRPLASRTAVVTGSSGGIGRAIALELARCGAAVLVHAGRNREGAQAVADEVRSMGGQTGVVVSDLADPDGRAALVEKASEWRPGIDVWVNNAGADVLTGPAARLPFEEKLELLWRVDVVATIQLARWIGRRMKAAGRGAILNVGWDGAERGMAGDSGELFAATKGAIMAFTRSLAQSLAPEVRVNCLAPGWIRTGWGEGASQTWQDRAHRESLRGRWGTPEDVACAARFLASDDADFVTGQIVHINGGWTSGGGSR